MNFRVNLAVAFAAALSFACADKQAADPVLEEAMKAPPGATVLGVYEMRVQRVETAEGVRFAFNPVPIGAGGLPTQNPPGTVQVIGTFGGVVLAGDPTLPATCTGSATGYLSANVVVTNFAVDPLRNVWVEILNMNGTTGNDACNSTSPFLSEGAYSFGSAEQRMGIWKYPDLAGSTVANGSKAGGSGSTITNGAWWFKYNGGASFTFTFRVMADNNAPVLTNTPALTSGQPLSFYNIAANGGPTKARLEICNVNPGPPVNGNPLVPCPAGATVNVAETVFGTNVPATGRNVFSVIPKTILANGTYWWRARNYYPAGPGALPSQWSSFTFTSVPVNQTAASFLANDGAALIEWTTEPATVDTYWFLCQGPCTVATPIVLGQGFAAADPLGDPRFPGLSYYSAVPNFALNPATADLVATGGIYWLPNVTYGVKFMNSDGVTAPVVTAPGTTGSTTIAPVAIAPSGLTPVPAGTLSVATNPVFSWTSDVNITSTTIDFVEVVNPLDRLQDVLISTNPVAKVGTTYSINAFNAGLQGYVNATMTVEAQVFNTDLYGSISFLAVQYSMKP